MKVLVIGATGNVGVRVVAALLTHGHTVVAFVRSASKLESLVSPTLYRKISNVVQGNATDSPAIAKTILDNKCDAVVNAAGMAAMAPWGKSELPMIFKAVVRGLQEAVKERGKPLRFWCLGGMTALNYPGTETMLMSYIPLFMEHAQDLALLQSLPPNTLDWSMLCPSTMTPESSEITIPVKSSPHGRLLANAGSPPMFQESWMSSWIPFLGRILTAGMNAGRYETTLEQNAEFIASDLESKDESKFSGRAVGVIDGSK